ncbi:NADH-ubiquinone oxidoreductase chain C [Candidatus Sumerlaea chitinivorans]|uniref:NADH-quinone oxidoreductase subunit C n=1 Tax=Sumerlaea chitinivorans TaxID=2250252 RepID=A0A2Z4Y3Y2_SUMC1|nr:NADH-ubiquinone oxidoreductase chain C [Candidatus Sumerlaea chitinivorans]
MEPTLIFEHMQSKFGATKVVELRDRTIPPTICVHPSAVREVLHELKNNRDLAFDYLQLITGVDYPMHFEVVYHLTSLTYQHSLAVKAQIPRDNPVIASIADLYPAANWHEREQFDLMGIIFEGHPDLRRILCPEDWEGHPLRKDYVQPLEYHGISNVRKCGDDWYPKPDEDAKAIVPLKAPASKSPNPAATQGSPQAKPGE